LVSLCFDCSFVVLLSSLLRAGCCLPFLDSSFSYLLISIVHTFNQGLYISSPFFALSLTEQNVIFHSSFPSTLSIFLRALSWFLLLLAVKVSSIEVSPPLNVSYYSFLLALFLPRCGCHPLRPFYPISVPSIPLFYCSG